MEGIPNVPQLDEGVVDADTHYYEADDAYTRHLEARFTDDALHIRRGDDGLGKIWIGNRRLAFMSVTPRDYVRPPGSLRLFFAGEEDRAAASNDPIPCDPAYIERDARLRQLDEHGVAAAVMFPTLGAVVEHELHDDVDVLQAHLRSFNRWLEDDWGFAAEDRIFCAAMISLTDLDQALVELDRVLAAGARWIHLKSGPVYGRSPADPCFDPFWARVTEAGAAVAFHAGDSGYNELVSTQWGEPARLPSWKMSALQSFLGFHRPIIDTLAALVLQGLFRRHPTARVVSIEQGSSWVPGLLHDLDAAHRFHAADMLPGEWPSEVFKRHVWVSPFHEEDVHGLVDAIGADHVLFGSDFPHPEGVAQPGDFADALSALPADDVDKIMRRNTAELLGLSDQG